MLTGLRPSGLLLAATLTGGAVLFAGYCQLHALAAGMALPWTAPIWWGLIAGAPAGGFGFALCRWRIRATRDRRPSVVAAGVFTVVLGWGVVTRGIIGPGELPQARELAKQLFVVIPVAAAFSGAAALMLRRQSLAATAASPWIELPEEPLLRLRAEEVGWVSAAGNYCEFHMADRVHLVRLPLTRAAERLEVHGFARAHRSALVNLAALISVEPGGSANRPVARLRCGTTLPVGARFRPGLLAAVTARSSRA
jgi:two-component system LytT family response regulator